MRDQCIRKQLGRGVPTLRPDPHQCVPGTGGTSVALRLSETQPHPDLMSQNLYFGRNPPDPPYARCTDRSTGLTGVQTALLGSQLYSVTRGF